MEKGDREKPERKKQLIGGSELAFDCKTGVTDPDWGREQRGGYYFGENQGR